MSGQSYAFLDLTWLTVDTDTEHLDNINYFVILL